MQNDTEKQRQNRGHDNFKGKKSGNNLALPTSKQPDPEAKSNGWAVRNRLIKGAKEIAEFAESTKSQTVIVDGQEVEMSMIAHAFYKQLKKAIDKDDTRAFLAYIQSTEGFTSKHALVGENGKIVNPTISFTKSESDILKELGAE